jgi:hypothetical protein
VRTAGSTKPPRTAAIWLAYGGALRIPRPPATGRSGSTRTRLRARSRVAALGRKNFLFVGTDHAGENLAGLYSLTATCEANEGNPVDCLADVLLRVQTHPASRVDEFLPHNWTRASADSS